MAEVDLEIIDRPNDILVTELKSKFLYLPFYILLHSTNILDLVRKQQDKNRKKLDNDELIKHVREIHREMHTISWNENGLMDLKFNEIDNEEERNASIFGLSPEKQNKIHKRATPFQRQFLYLPLSILKSTTTIRELAMIIFVNEETGRVMKDRYINKMIQDFHGQMHMLKRWEHECNYCNGLFDVKFTKNTPVAVGLTEKPTAQKPVNEPETSVNDTRLGAVGNKVQSPNRKTINTDEHGAEKSPDGTHDAAATQVEPMDVQTTSISSPNYEPPETQFQENEIQQTSTQMNNLNDENSKICVKSELVSQTPREPMNDSNLMCLGSPVNEIITIDDSSDDLNELDYIMGRSGLNTDSFGSQNISTTQNLSDTSISTADELVDILSSGISQVAQSTQVSSSQVAQSTQLSSSQVQPTPDIPDQTLVQNESVQRIENTISSAENIRLQSPFKRPIENDAQNNPKDAERTKKSAINDTLSTIQPPRYEYQPLQLINKQAAGTTHQTAGQKSTKVCATQQPINVLPLSQQIDSDHDTQFSEVSAVIEDDSSDDITQIQSSESTAKRLLLTQENNIFLGIDTQPHKKKKTQNNLESTTSNQLELPTTSNADTNRISEPETLIEREMSLLKTPSLINSYVNYVYLYYIDIEQVVSKMSLQEGKSKHTLELHLKYQCNGGSRIVVSGESPKYLLQMSDKEWNDVNQIFRTIGNHAFHLNNSPNNKSFLHRLVQCLFRTKTKFSSVHVSYNEQDFETARIFERPYVVGQLDLTAAINSSTLHRIKKRREMLN